MGKRIFAEAGYDISSLILPVEEFEIFCDREKGLFFRGEYRDEAIKNAEGILDKKYRLITACDYLAFVRTGERSRYELHYNERRRDLLTFVLAETYEKTGRFTDKILDLVWMILEESTWIIPASLNPRPGDKTHSLPYSYDGKRNYINLSAGSTGALLAWVWYLCRDSFDAISPVINKRIIENLHDRIIAPFIENTGEQAWMGNGAYNWINNWCPWIISNVLNVCAFTVTDKEKREQVVRIAMEGLDKFTSIYEEDGACDEGPTYWEVAGGALYNACLVLYDMSAGRINAFKDPLVRKIGEFFPKTYISSGRFLNFSDGQSKLGVENSWGHDWGILSDSDLMQKFWEYAYTSRGKLPRTELNMYNMPYRYFRMLGAPELPYRDFKAPKVDYLPSLDLSICRDEEEYDKGLYLSLKGGHNDASHNHLDIGNFVIFCDGVPIFIDAGVGTYTARTFNQDRYTIWSMRSEYHNIPTINGIDQSPGRHFAAENAQFDENSGKLSLDLTNAYPKSAKLEAYTRSAVIEDGKAIVCDTITSAENGEISFNLLCNCEPKLVGSGCFTVHGKRVEYDASLKMSIDCPDTSLVETQILPARWDCEKIYRIRLHATLDAYKKYTFKLVVNR